MTSDRAKRSLDDIHAHSTLHAKQHSQHGTYNTVVLISCRRNSTPICGVATSSDAADLANPSVALPRWLQLPHPHT